MDVLVVAPREQIETVDHKPQEPTEILAASALVRRATTLFRFELDPRGDFFAGCRVPVVVIEGAVGEFNLDHVPAPAILAKLRDPIGLVAVWGRSPCTGRRHPWIAHAITTAHKRRGEIEVYAPGSTACISRFELLDAEREVVAQACTTHGQAAIKELAKQHPDAVAVRVAMDFGPQERHYTPPILLAPSPRTPPQAPPTPASAAPPPRPRARVKHSTPNPDELPQHLAQAQNKPQSLEKEPFSSNNDQETQAQRSKDLTSPRLWAPLVDEARLAPWP